MAGKRGAAAESSTEHRLAKKPFQSDPLYFLRTTLPLSRYSTSSSSPTITDSPSTVSPITPTDLDDDLYIMPGPRMPASTPTHAPRRRPHSTPSLAQYQRQTAPQKSRRHSHRATLINRPNPYKNSGRQTWNWIHQEHGPSALEQSTGFSFTWPRATQYDPRRHQFMPDDQVLKVGPGDELPAYHGLPHPNSIQNFNLWDPQSRQHEHVAGNSRLFDHGQWPAMPSSLDFPRPNEMTKTGFSPGSEIFQAVSSYAGLNVQAQQAHQMDFSHGLSSKNSYNTGLPFNNTLDSNDGLNFNTFPGNGVLQSTFPMSTQARLPMLSTSFPSNGTRAPQQWQAGSSRMMTGAHPVPEMPPFAMDQNAPTCFTTSHGQIPMPAFDSHQIGQSPHIPMVPTAEMSQLNIAMPQPFHEQQPNFTSRDNSSQFDYDTKVPTKNTPFLSGIESYGTRYPAHPDALADALTNAEYSQRPELPSASSTNTGPTPALSFRTNSSAPPSSYSTANNTALATPSTESPANSFLPQIGDYAGSDWDKALEDISQLDLESMGFDENFNPY